MTRGHRDDCIEWPATDVAQREAGKLARQLAELMERLMCEYAITVPERDEPGAGGEPRYADGDRNTRGRRASAGTQ